MNKLLLLSLVPLTFFSVHSFAGMEKGLKCSVTKIFRDSSTHIWTGELYDNEKKSLELSEKLTLEISFRETVYVTVYDKSTAIDYGNGSGKLPDAISHFEAAPTLEGSILYFRAFIHGHNVGCSEAFRYKAEIKK